MTTACKMILEHALQRHNFFFFQIELDEPINDEQADAIMMFVDTDGDDHLSEKGMFESQN